MFLSWSDIKRVLKQNQFSIDEKPSKIYIFEMLFCTSTSNSKVKISYFTRKHKFLFYWTCIPKIRKEYTRGINFFLFPAGTKKKSQKWMKFTLNWYLLGKTTEYDVASIHTVDGYRSHRQGEIFFFNNYFLKEATNYACY